MYAMRGNREIAGVDSSTRTAELDRRVIAGCDGAPVESLCREEWAETEPPDCSDDLLVQLGHKASTDPCSSE
jgi:hypothetical protein